MQRNPNLPSALTETQTKPSPGRCPPGTPTRRQALGRLPTPPPLPENLLSDCTENCPLCPLRAPRRFRNPKIGQQLGAQPTPRLGGGLGDASPARRGSRSRPPLRRPRPLRFERLRMSGSECGIHTAEAASPCEAGRPKGRRRESRRKSHNFFKHLPHRPASTRDGSLLFFERGFWV